MVEAYFHLKLTAGGYTPKNYKAFLLRYLVTLPPLENCKYL